MKNRMNGPAVVLTAVVAVMLSAVCTGCSSAEQVRVAGTGGELVVEIKAGSEWLHEFKILPGIYVKNPPQYAVWLEDSEGSYLDTIAVTEKMAVEGWAFNGDNRRLEALPYWVHRRGHVYSDGLMLPNGNEPLPDDVTAASTKGGVQAGFNSPKQQEMLKIFAEFNHSTDFNNVWPADASEGSVNWSGGEFGSGQPSIIYSAEFNPDLLTGEGIVLTPEGCGSADGSDGFLHEGLQRLTTAKNITSGVVVRRSSVIR